MVPRDSWLILLIGHFVDGIVIPLASNWKFGFATMCTSGVINAGSSFISVLNKDSWKSDDQVCTYHRLLWIPEIVYLILLLFLRFFTRHKTLYFISLAGNLFLSLYLYGTNVLAKHFTAFYPPPGTIVLVLGTCAIWATKLIFRPRFTASAGVSLALSLVATQSWQEFVRCVLFRFDEFIEAAGALSGWLAVIFLACSLHWIFEGDKPKFLDLTFHKIPPVDPSEYPSETASLLSRRRRTGSSTGL